MKWGRKRTPKQRPAPQAAPQVTPAPANVVINERALADHLIALTEQIGSTADAWQRSMDAAKTLLAAWPQDGSLPASGADYDRIDAAITALQAGLTELAHHIGAASEHTLCADIVVAAAATRLEAARQGRLPSGAQVAAEPRP
jgi:hypothetical protein